MTQLSSFPRIYGLLFLPSQDGINKLLILTERLTKETIETFGSNYAEPVKETDDWTIMAIKTDSVAKSDWIVWQQDASTIDRTKITPESLKELCVTATGPILVVNKDNDNNSFPFKKDAAEDVLKLITMLVTVDGSREIVTLNQGYQQNQIMILPAKGFDMQRAGRIKSLFIRFLIFVSKLFKRG